MSNYIELICLSLTVIIGFFLVDVHLKWKAIDRKCKAAFNNVYGQSSSRPKYAMHSSYGFPALTVKFGSKMELEDARINGLNHKFSKAIEELCRNMGTDEHPFQVEKAILFTSEDNLDGLRKTFSA